MKVTKVYGIRGLLEWHGRVGSNGVWMHVDFVNGSATGFGVAPATFTTSDVLTQHIIENSEQFKSGRIRLERVYGVEAVEPPQGGGAAGDGGGQSGSVALHTTPLSDGGGAGTGGAVPAETEGEVVKVADKYDAIEWLKEHFPQKGYTSSGLRSKGSFEAACRESGVRFEFS